MKKTLAVALVALAAACSSEKPKTIQWGAPQDPNSGEKAAVADAALSLQSSLSYQASTQPTAGAAGLGDQLAASLQSAAAARMPDGSSAKLAQGAVRQAFETGGMDPNCVVPAELDGVSTWTWTNCQIDLTSGTMTMHAVIDGWLKWNPALRQTTWSIGTTARTTMSGVDSVTVDTTAGLDGKMTVTDSTIVADTTSTVHARASTQGPSGNFVVDDDTQTTLTARLQYQPDPFCITGGTLTVVHEETVYGQTQLDGWDLAWTGCGASAFQVRHGS